MKTPPRHTAPRALTRTLLGASLLALATAPTIASEHASEADDGPEPEAESADAGEAAANGEVGREEATAADGETDGRPTYHYPTAAIADYVLGCMVANGNTYESLQRCSCSIDYLMDRMDYKTYEQAGTILQVQRDTGQRGIFYRDSNWAKRKVEALEALQAESTLRCF